MHILGLIALVFFLGIGIVFEVIGFIFKLLFSGFGLVVGLILAAVTALVAVPLVLGLVGVIIPKGLLVIALVGLFVIIVNRSRKSNGRRKADNFDESKYYRY